VRQVKNLDGKSRKKDNDKNEEHSFLFFSFRLVVKSQSLQNNLYFSLTADVNVEVFLD